MVKKQHKHWSRRTHTDNTTSELNYTQLIQLSSPSNPSLSPYLLACPPSRQSHRPTCLQTGAGDGYGAPHVEPATSCSSNRGEEGIYMQIVGCCINWLHFFFYKGLWRGGETWGIWLRTEHSMSSRKLNSSHLSPPPSLFSSFMACPYWGYWDGVLQSIHFSLTHESTSL